MEWLAYYLMGGTTLMVLNLMRIYVPYIQAREWLLLAVTMAWDLILWPVSLAFWVLVGVQSASAFMLERMFR